jgi:hypothetical protein
VLSRLGTTVVGGAAVALAGCGASSPKVRNLPRRAQRGDIELLSRGLQLERRTIAAYTAGIPLLRGKQATIGKAFLQHELEHAGELIRLLDELGVKPPLRAASYDIGHPQGPEQVLGLWHELESLQLSLYLDLIPRLTPGRIRSGVASVFASDAQHTSLLRIELRSRPAPAAFATGRE